MVQPIIVAYISYSNDKLHSWNHYIWVLCQELKIGMFNGVNNNNHNNNNNSNSSNNSNNNNNNNNNNNKKLNQLTILGFSYESFFIMHAEQKGTFQWNLGKG